jgi:hypothetical protein
MLKPVALLLLSMCMMCGIAAQQPITVDEVRYNMEVLAGDSLQGRGNLQPGLLKAAFFVGNSFSRAGLIPLPGHASFFIPFRPAGGKKNERADLIEGLPKGKGLTDYMYMRVQPGPYPSRDAHHFTSERVEAFDDSTLLRYAKDTTPLLLWSSTRLPGKKKLNGMRFIFPPTGLSREVLMVIADTLPAGFTVRPNMPYFATLEYNVVGMLPGNDAASIMVSSHYDHEGIINGEWTDTIMNGANDNASGTTGVLTLAKSFAAGPRPARSMIFAAFAGEELGLTGSENFAATEDLANIIAVINLEMIGLPQFGNRTVFITGQYDSGLPALLGPELGKAGLTVVNDPVPDKKLYERSDNYSFALRDIPAHTIMSSTDDDECYHQFCDEVRRIDMINLTAVINAVRSALQPLADATISREKIR